MNGLGEGLQIPQDTRILITSKLERLIEGFHTKRYNREDLFHLLHFHHLGDFYHSLLPYFLSSLPNTSVQSHEGSVEEIYLACLVVD